MPILLGKDDTQEIDTIVLWQYMLIVMPLMALISGAAIYWVGKIMTVESKVFGQIYRSLRILFLASVLFFGLSSEVGSVLTIASILFPNVWLEIGSEIFLLLATALFIQSCLVYMLRWINICLKATYPSPATRRATAIVIGLVLVTEYVLNAVYVGAFITARLSDRFVRVAEIVRIVVFSLDLLLIALFSLIVLLLGLLFIARLVHATNDTMPADFEGQRKKLLSSLITAMLLFPIAVLAALICLIIYLWASFVGDLPVVAVALLAISIWEVSIILFAMFALDIKIPAAGGRKPSDVLERYDSKEMSFLRYDDEMHEGVAIHMDAVGAL